MQTTQDEIEIDLRELIIELLSNIVPIIVSTIIGAVVLGIISIFLLTPKYTSTSQIYVMNTTGLTSLTDLQMGSSLAKDYEEMIKSRPVIEQVGENLKLDSDYEEILSYITVENKENTRIIRITATHSEPQMAMDLANELTNVAKVQIADIMKVEEPTIVEKAVLAEKPSSPNNKRNILLGALLGFLLAAGFVSVRFVLDDTLKNADDVEKFLNLNTLAAIPLEGGTDNSEKESHDNKKRFHGIRKERKS